MASQLYLQHLTQDVKNMRVKHIRQMFVLLRELGEDLKLADLEHKTDWVEFESFNNRLQLLVVQHGLTLGEFATGYVLGRQKTGEDEDSFNREHKEQSPNPKKRKTTTKGNENPTAPKSKQAKTKK